MYRGMCFLSEGSFAFMNGSKSATLESPTLTQNEIANNVSLCLKFSFLISNMGKSNIRVDLKSYGSVKTLMRLTGYHGQKWSAAQVSWTSVENSKVYGISKTIALCEGGEEGGAVLHKTPPLC